MPDRPWKAEERRVAGLVGGARYPATSGRRIDVESTRIVCQVKHRRTLSLAQVEALAVELERLGAGRGKLGVLCVKRRAGRGRPTPRLLVMTEAVWLELMNGSGAHLEGGELSEGGLARRLRRAARPSDRSHRAPHAAPKCAGGHTQHYHRQRPEAFE